MMFPRAHTLSRRQILAGAAATATYGRWPTTAHAETTADGTHVLRARAGGAPQGGARPELLGYGGVLPGPTLRLKRGEELRVRLVNEFAEPTSIHWHGVRVPNAMDGVPGLTQAPVPPGGSFDYRFRPPDAGTFWYHAYAAGQSDRGLSGALVVEEPQNVAVDRDVVLLLGMPPAANSLPVIVNGVRPDIPVQPGERLRLRLINATAARGVALRIDGHAAWLMAIDGQPSEPFLSREGRIALGPGSRVDLVVDALRNSGTIAPILASVGDEQPIARLVYRSGAVASKARAQPTPFPANPLPERIDLRTALRQDLPLGATKPLDPAKPLFTVRRGRAVVLALRNPPGHPQVLHVHGHSFRHLDRLDDGWKPFWLDTIVVAQDTERIAFVADNPGKWLIAVRALDRPDAEAQFYFVVS